MVEFISYDGSYPNLCSGNLVLKIDGEIVNLPQYSMMSGGRAWLDEEGNSHIETGLWRVDVPKEYLRLRKEIERCVNENVSCGCCGGCL